MEKALAEILNSLLMASVGAILALLWFAPTACKIAGL